MKFQTLFFLASICIGSSCQSATIPTPQLISTEPVSAEPTTQPKTADKRFAELILDGTRAVIQSSRGQMPGGWIGASEADDLRAIPGGNDGVTWPMEDDWIHAATLLEYGGILEVAPGSFTAIKFGALVFPDETVRLVKMC